MRSVMAWCYVTTLEVWQDLGKTLFRGQCRWKNFSPWRKQTAHWLCSLLSACINRPLTSHSVILSLKHIVVTAAVQIQTNWLSVCRGHAQTYSAARIRLKLPSFTLSLTNPHKQTRYMLRDLVSTGPMKLPGSPSSVLETTQGLEIPFSQKPRVKPPLGMSLSWQRAEVEHKCDCVCAVCMGLEVGPVLGAKFCRTGAKLWPEVKIELLVFRRYAWWEWSLASTKAEEAVCSVLPNGNPQWPCSRFTVCLTFSQFLCGCYEGKPGFK